MRGACCQTGTVKLFNQVVLTLPPVERNLKIQTYSSWKPLMCLMSVGSPFAEHRQPDDADKTCLIMGLNSR